MEERDLVFDVEAGVPLLIRKEEEEDDDLYSIDGQRVSCEDIDEDDVAVESLDYDSIHSVVQEQLLKQQHHKHRHLYGCDSSIQTAIHQCVSFPLQIVEL